VQNERGVTGWQARKPDGYVDVPYSSGVDVCRAEVAQDEIYCPEGKKDVDTLAPKHQWERGNRWCYRLVGWPSYPRRLTLSRVVRGCPGFIFDRQFLRWKWSPNSRTIELLPLDRTIPAVLRGGLPLKSSTPIADLRRRAHRRRRARS
jgi:hypothetical protein